MVAPPDRHLLLNQRIAAGANTQDRKRKLFVLGDIDIHCEEKANEYQRHFTMAVVVVVVMVVMVVVI